MEGSTGLSEITRRGFSCGISGGGRRRAQKAPISISCETWSFCGRIGAFGPVRTFLGYVLTHRHEAQSLLQFEKRTDDVVARGRIDARGTLLTRLVVGHPSLLIYEEPVRNFNTGPNQVVAWVVQRRLLLRRGFSLFSPQNRTMPALLKRRWRM